MVVEIWSIYRSFIRYLALGLGSLYIEGSGIVMYERSREFFLKGILIIVVGMAFLEGEEGIVEGCLVMYGMRVGDLRGRVECSHQYLIVQSIDFMMTFFILSLRLRRRVSRSIFFIRKFGNSYLIPGFVRSV